MGRRSPSKEAKLPKKITMGPYTFTVTTDQDLITEVAGREAAGVSNLGYALIGVVDSPEVDFIFKADTLLHELIHLSFRVSGYEFKDRELEEGIVLAISTSLLGCLRDNPAVIDYLTHRD